MRGLRLVTLAALLCVGAAPAAQQPSFDARARALDGDTLSVDFRLLRVSQRADVAIAGLWSKASSASQSLLFVLYRSRDIAKLGFA
ncbi:hypothetical protein A6768_11705 [Sphingobium yanoikuyae]|uniref:Uncharacterized protein n=1 Tax=Sphingobium yanoikuyae TaxID=13690 RepID=A0A291MZQ3_SPHYA|nr:hypothetical protein A6768_11705 [Sphingobium yanoikuyae]